MESIPTELLRLTDGRVLEYGVFGDPSGEPALFFHGFIGSHHQAHLAHEPAARHGLRLIAVNRPGVGRSTPRARKKITDAVGDVEQLAAALGLERFSVLGVSGGAPYALACRALLPGRVRQAVIVSGLGPVCEAGLLSRMNPLARTALQTARWVPAFVRWLLHWRTQQLHSDPEGFLNWLVQRWSHSDQALFRRPEVRAMFLGDLREVLVHGEGVEGLVREMQLYFEWGFSLKDLPSGGPVTFWHGTSDLLVPPAVSRYVAGQLGTEVLYRPGGHFMVLEHAEEILTRSLGALRAGGK